MSEASSLDSPVGFAALSDANESVPDCWVEGFSETVPESAPLRTPMGPSQQRPGRRRRVGFRLPNLALIASLLLHPSPTPLASAAAVDLPVPATADPSPRLHRRNDGEHVVLADCRDRAGFISSQIAYFAGEPGPDPADVAVVVTESGQAALWVNGNTSALFTNTGVTFTATLGPAVREGQFAGTGENGYGNFSCYRSYVNALYIYDSTTCSQVYLCDHSIPPAPATASSSGAMSRGTVIGIAVGVGGGVLFVVAAGLVFWFLRRSRKSRQAARNPDPSELGSGTGTLSPGPASETGEPKAQPVMQQMRAVYEIDGRLFRIEMASDTGKFELDPGGHGNAELASDAPREETATASTSPETKSVSPVSPLLDSPQSPPPEYSPPNRTGGEPSG